MKANENWVCVYKTPNKMEAEILIGNLENNEIRAVLLSKQDSSYLSFGYVEVHVPESLIEKAMLIINENKQD
jgi:hypothetical protein